MKVIGILCACGCGQHTQIATKNNTASGTVKGQPRRFCKGHNARKHPHNEPVGLRRRRQRYGLEPADLEAMLIAQDNRCANLACRVEIDLGADIDHDHGDGPRSGPSLLALQSRGRAVRRRSRASARPGGLSRGAVIKIIGILCWYDERPSSLAGVVTALARVGVSHVVAVDGAYALYPEGRAYSDREQHATISEVCKALGIGCTLYAPVEPFVDNEVEKRSVSLRLAESIAEPFEDWYFVVDADHFVVSAIGHLDLLATTACDVAAVRLTEGDGSMWCRCVFRAVPGLRYEGNHFTPVTPTGQNLHDSTSPVLDLSRVEVEHRVGQRDTSRREKQLSYYERRDRLGIEGLTCV